MKIKSLTLKNIRTYADQTIEFDKINVLAGPNGAGKTTVQAAIEYLLTGKCAFTDGQGREATDMVTFGEESGEVSMTIQIGEEELTLRRSIPGAFSIDGWAGTQTKQQEELYKLLGTQEKIVTAVLNTGSFLNMPPADQKNMLFNLMGLAFDKDTIGVALGEWLDERAKEPKKELTDQGKEAIHDLFLKDYPKNIKGSGPEVFDQLEKHYKEKKKAAEYDLSKTQALQKATKPVLLPQGLTTAHRAGLEEILDTLNKEWNQLLQERADINATLKQNRTHEEQRARLEKSLEMAKDQLKGIEVDEKALEAEGKRIAALEKELTTKEKAQNQILAAVQKLLGETTSLFKIIQTLKESDGSCPLAEGRIKCTMTQSSRSKLVQEFEEEYAAKNKEFQDMQTRVCEGGPKIAEIKKEIRASKEAHDKAKAGAAKAQALKSSITENELMLKTIRIIGEGEARAALGDMDARLEKNTEERKRVENELTLIKQHQDVAGMIKGLEERRVREEATLKNAEVLVEAMGAKGIKRKMLKEIVEPLQARANEKLEELTQGTYKVEFSMDKDFEVKVTKGENSIKATKLSRSERFRVGIALQDVLNSLTGLNILIADDAEQLDPENKIALLNTFLAAEEYETIMIMAAIGETRPADPGIEGMRVFIVDSGTVQRAEGWDAADEVAATYFEE